MEKLHIPGVGMEMTIECDIAGSNSYEMIKWHFDEGESKEYLRAEEKTFKFPQFPHITMLPYSNISISSYYQITIFPFNFLMLAQHCHMLCCNSPLIDG